MSDEVIVCIGSLDTGYVFMGPFDDADAAEEWLEASQYEIEHYMIVALEP